MKKLYSIMGTLALAGTAMAQTSLPNAIATINFEGVQSPADLGAELVGAGEFKQSADSNFGVYYQNNPEGSLTTHGNYLIIPTQGFVSCHSKSSEVFSIGFWINGYVANEKQGTGTSGHYYSTAIAAYSQANSYKTFSWPMFSARTRGILQINCNGWSDYVNEENVNGANVESNEWIQTKQVEGTVTDAEGNEVPGMVNTAFDENWHYVTLTFNGINAKFYVDGEIKNEWNASNNNYSFPSVTDALDALYLGDCGPFFNDKDGAYAYDDIAMYATELTQDQIDLIIRIKRNEITEDDRISIAQAQLDAAKTELSDYCANLGDTFLSINNDVLDWLMASAEEGGIGDAYDYKNVDDINAAISNITKKQNDVNVIVNAHNEGMKTINFYSDMANNTMYAGAENFKTAIDEAKKAINNPTSTDAVAQAIAALESAKAEYLFTQTLPADNSGFDVTRMIDNPWFCDETIEPSVDAQGNATYAEANPGCSKGAWENTCTLTDNKDCTMYYTQGRTTWNNFHSSTAVGGILDVHQTINGLKPGYYSVCADMVSSAAATDNHIFATANGVTKVSSIFGGNGWDAISAGVGAWETLTTDKVLVGEDGKLTIGATATTNGTAYAGWYCVTNFQLRYFGTEYDFSNDVTAKKEEAENAMSQLILFGDKKNAVNSINEISASNDIDYDKVAKFTSLIASINDTYAQEMAFTAGEDIKALAENEENETIKAIYKSASDEINTAVKGDDATVEILPSLNTLYSAYLSYADAAAAALNWGTEAATAEVNSQVADINGATTDKLADNKEKLIAIMKASITEFQASEDNPKDISGLINNPSFTGDSNAGWTISGDCANWYSECEFYNNNFDIHQIITSLPAGAYRVTVQGFYRDGGRDTAVEHYNNVDEEGNNGFIANAQLYANEMKSPLSSLGASNIIGDSNIETTHADGSTYAWYQPNADTAESTDIISYPDGMNSAQFCFDKGLYADNKVDIVLSETGDLKIGIEKQTTINTDWAIFDNFKLYYLGSEAPTCIESTPSNAAASAIYNAAGVRVSSLKKGINIVRMSDGTIKKILK